MISSDIRNGYGLACDMIITPFDDIKIMSLLA
nr:MAG TPA: hypothetical protein [Caudoviricetes sp.]